MPWAARCAPTNSYKLPPSDPPSTITPGASMASFIENSAPRILPSRTGVRSTLAPTSRRVKSAHTLAIIDTHGRGVGKRLEAAQCADHAHHVCPLVEASRPEKTGGLDTLVVARNRRMLRNSHDATLIGDKLRARFGLQRMVPKPDAEPCSWRYVGHLKRDVLIEQRVRRPYRDCCHLPSLSLIRPSTKNARGMPGVPRGKYAYGHRP